MKLSVEVPEINTLLEVMKRVEAQNQKLIEHQNGSVWLTDKELAERWKISLSTLHRWRTEYNIPNRQIGDCRRYNANRVDEWFDSYSAEGIISLKHKEAA